MPDNNPTPTQALRKRQQIENAGKKMFLWVAGAAALVGLCAVLSVSLFERIAFRQEIIGMKTETVGNLQHNITVASELKDQVRVLNTNEALLATPRLEDSEPLSVILDALPSKANSSALGASLQQKLLNEGGVTLEALTVNPIAGVEDETDASSSGGEVAEGEIGFQFSVSAPTGSADRLREVLRRLERSIRTINITSVTVDQQGNKVVLTAEGKGYYQTATRVELKVESERP
ncbi:MAG: hypothetical protein V4678_03725 [Patescibacteria group bacterium]